MGIKKDQNKGKLSKQWKILIILVAIVLVIFGYFKMFNRSENIVESNKTSEVTKVTDNKTYSASLLACGDVMAHMPQLKAQYNASTKKYSFDNNYKYVKKYIKNADLAMANLETTLCGDDVYAYSSYPTFNTPDALADSLKNVGFDLLSTINNHSFDMSSLGVERTLSTLKKKGFDTVGTREKKSDDEYVIENVNGIKLGITAYSYGEIKNGTKYLNGIKVSDEKNNLMNVFDISDVDTAFNTIYSTVKKYQKDTDMQIVIIHWGDEYSRTPSKFQTELAQKLCDAGIDIIIGSHPHVVQGTETYNGKPIVYSLGNFCFGGNRNPSDTDTMIYQLSYSFKGTTQTGYQVQIIPCSLTSSRGRNDYQPYILQDEQASRVKEKIKKYSY